MPSPEGGILTETTAVGSSSNKLLPEQQKESMLVKQQQKQQGDVMLAGSIMEKETSTAGKEGGDKVVVAVRVRPFASMEQQHGRRSCVVMGEEGEVVLRDDVNAVRAFRFDHCFDSSNGTATQEEVFSKVGKDLLNHAWMGYNSSVFAYGQTGSGKTYTMMGGSEDEEEGLVPRVGRALLSSIQEAKNSRRAESAASSSLSSDEEDGVSYSLKATYIEIYNEKVYDLMGPPSSSAAGLRVRENPKTGPFVEGAVSKDVSSWEEMKAFLEQGNKSRRTAATNMNIESSRSHAVLTLEFRQSTSKRSYLVPTPSGETTLPMDGAVERVSRLCLVDLAGSERADKTGATGARLRESASINKSLVALGCVINALADQADRSKGVDNKENRDSPSKPANAGFIPYRDSTLTWLLSDALGGNAKTVMVATISPSPLQYEETLSTLRYADRAKCIVTHAVVNEDPKDRYIRNLEAELLKIKKQLQEQANNGGAPTTAALLAPQQPLQEQQQQQASAAAAEQEEKDRLISTLKIQNFARATLLSRARNMSSCTTKAETDGSDNKEGTESERPDACEGEAAAVAAVVKRPPPVTAELPYLIRLTEEAPTGQEETFFLSTEQTHFNVDGQIIPTPGSKEGEEEEEGVVAFTIQFHDGRLFVTVPPSRRLHVNGTEIFFEKRADEVSMEVWDGTRLAVDTSHIFLVMYDAVPPHATMPNTARRQVLHTAAWEALRTFPFCYWRLAQLEVKRGCQLSAVEVKGLCQGWMAQHTEGTDSAQEGMMMASGGLKSPASAEFSLVSSSASSEDEAEGSGIASQNLPPPPPPPQPAPSSGIIGPKHTVGSHARRPSPTEMGVSRLPRLAKAHRPLAPLAAAPALPAPVSTAQLFGAPPSSSSSSAAAAGDEGTNIMTLMPPPPPPMDSVGSTRRPPSIPMQDRKVPSDDTTTTTSSNDRQLVLVESSSSVKPPPPAPISITTTRPLFDPESNVQVLRSRASEAKHRLERAERHLVAAAASEVAQEERVSALKSQAMTALPLIMEATSLAMSTDRRASFFLDITPTTSSSGGSDDGATTSSSKRRRVKVLEGLASAEDRDLAAYLGISDQEEGGRELALPRLLELATQEYSVSVRVQNDVTGAVKHMSVEQFREQVLPALRESRASIMMGGEAAAPVAVGGGDVLDFVAEDVEVGTAQVYLSRLLDGKNILGVFPLMSGETGACVGAVSLRLIPEDVLPADGREGYVVRLEVDQVTLDRAELGHLVVPPGEGQQYHHQQQPEPHFVLQYTFFSQDMTGSIELSTRSSTARSLLTQRAAEQPGDHVSYPVTLRHDLSLPFIDAAFVAYLSTGALTMKVLVTRQGQRSADAAASAAHPAVGSDHSGSTAHRSYHLGGGGAAPPTERFQALHDVCLMQQQQQHKGVGGPALSDEGSAMSGTGMMNSTAPRHPQRSSALDGGLVVGGSDLQSIQGGDGYSRCFSTARPPSVAAARHSHFYSLHCRGGAAVTTFVYMMVDVLEPVLELGVDYHTDCPRHFKPVDVKRPRRHVNKSVMSSSSSASTTMSMMMLQGSRDFDDDMSIDRASEMWSEMDTSAMVAGGPMQQEPVFHISANQLIRTRRLRIVLEQVEPLTPFRLESCVRVLASPYVSVNERYHDATDLSQHTVPQVELDVISVQRSPNRRRLEVTVEMPTNQVLLERSSRGDRVVLMIQPHVFVEGAVQPIKFQRHVILKVLPLKRQTSMFYSMRKSLQDRTLDRMHQVGGYVAVKNEPANLLDEAVLDYVKYRLASQQRLLERTELARLYQEGREAGAGGNKESAAFKPRMDLTLESWKEVINSPKSSSSQLQQQQDVRNSMMSSSSSAAGGRRGRRPVPAFLDQVELQGTLDDPVARPGALKQQTVAAIFGVDVEVKRKAALRLGGDGVYRVVQQHEESEISAPAVAVAYPYPKRPAVMAVEQQQRDWDLLARVRTEDVPDYPPQRTGFLSMRTGLLGVSWTRVWFVWNRPFLYYYKNKTDHKMQGVINVTECRITRGTEDYEMIFRGPRRTWHLQAANDDDFLQWATSLNATSELLGGGEPSALLAPPAPQHLLLTAGPSASQSVWSDN